MAYLRCFIIKTVFDEKSKEQIVSGKGVGFGKNLLSAWRRYRMNILK